MTSRKLTQIGVKMMRMLDMGEWFEDGQSRLKFVFVKDLKDVGGSWWHAEERRGEVYVLRSLEGDDIYTTLIHELLHVLLEGHKACPGGKYDRDYEFGLNRATTALWKYWKQFFIA